VDAGNLTTNAVVTANGAGTVTLNADAGTIDINFAVSSTTGAIVVTGDVITQDANIATGGSGTVNVTADNGAITMADAISTLSVNGSITYSATTNVALALLTSTDAAISVTAGSGSSVVGAITEILSTETANIVTTGTVTLTAETGIGASGTGDIDTTIGTLTASTLTSGPIYIQETNGLIIGTPGVTTAGGGLINIDVDAGNLTVDAVVTANGVGTVTLNADVGTVDINAIVSSTTGAVLITGDAITRGLWDFNRRHWNRHRHGRQWRDYDDGCHKHHIRQRINLILRHR
jgi:hypothetical protein